MSWQNHDRGVGKVLYEVLTATDAIPLPMTGPRIDHNLFRHGSVRPSPSTGRQPHLEPTATV